MRVVEIYVKGNLKAVIKEAKRRHRQRLERNPNTKSTIDMWWVIQCLIG